MRKVLTLILITAALLTACTSLESSPENSPTSAAITLPFVSGTSNSTEDYVEVKQGELWMRVLTPRNNSIVSTETIDVSGQAPAGTVITINQKLLLVPPDQFFRITLTLQAGPNLVEIVASDANNNQIQIILLVTYQP